MRSTTLISVTPSKAKEVKFRVDVVDGPAKPSLLPPFSPW